MRQQGVSFLSCALSCVQPSGTLPCALRRQATNPLGIYLSAMMLQWWHVLHMLSVCPAYFCYMSVISDTWTARVRVSTAQQPSKAAVVVYHTGGKSWVKSYLGVGNKCWVLCCHWLPERYMVNHPTCFGLLREFGLGVL